MLCIKGKLEKQVERGEMKNVTLEDHLTEEVIGMITFVCTMNQNNLSDYFQVEVIPNLIT